MEWLIIGGGILILAILGDRYIAKRGRVPLSKVRPELIDPNEDRPLGMEQTDLALMEKVSTENDLLNAINGARNNQGENYMNKVVPRLKVKPRQKDGPSK